VCGGRVSRGLFLNIFPHSILLLANILNSLEENLRIIFLACPSLLPHLNNPAPTALQHHGPLFFPPPRDPRHNHLVGVGSSRSSPDHQADVSPGELPSWWFLAPGPP
jgi:hypothetical protein